MTITCFLTDAKILSNLFVRLFVCAPSGEGVFTDERLLLCNRDKVSDCIFIYTCAEVIC